MRLARLLLTALLVLAPPALRAAEDSTASLQFDDAPLAEPLEHPEWFKQSFLELPEDLRQATAAGKLVSICAIALLAVPVTPSITLSTSPLGNPASSPVCDDRQGRYPIRHLDPRGVSD